MPEMPEVEVTRRSFADRLRGARVQGVRLGKPLRWPLNCRDADLVDRIVGLAERRGKYIWLPVGDAGLLMHLGMSGSLRLFAPSESAGEAGPHDHFDLLTTQGVLRLNDPRRFGAVIWSPSIEDGMAGRLTGGLGIEPFDPDFDGIYLHRALRGRRVAIKQALLGGGIVVGAGNIYACEALFEAGIDPRTRGHRLSKPRCERLASSLRRVLARALELGGSTLRDFSDAHGVAGAFQLEARVYGRQGLPCHVCGAVVRRVVQAQRSTFYCPSCQAR
jgi:formamidopyrimidine-DNA glycosylase